MPSIILNEADLKLDTRCQKGIHNHMSRVAPGDGAYKLEHDYDKEYPHAKPRKVGPCNTYNCHGLTFASRRSNLEFSEIFQILEEDDYQHVDRKDVMPGDIVVFISTGQIKGSTPGDVEHSGIVVEHPDALGNVKIDVLPVSSAS
jgi:hypothetical protein